MADLGVLVPIAVALILVNGLSATAVLLPAGVLYIAAGLYYRVPVPVQPLKAFGAIAVAQGFGPDVVAAGALLMAAVFVPLGFSGLLDKVAGLVPLPIVRGVQLSVGLIFLKLAWGLVAAPPSASPDAAAPPWLLGGLAVATALAAFWGRARGVALVLLAIAVTFVVLRFPGAPVWGPSPLRVGLPPADAFGVAFVALVLPQLPLTFANSCIATADVAGRYFGDRARRVTPGRLAISLGLANAGVGLIGGMPLCHGAGGMTAHRAFGARTGWGTAALGGVLAVLALALGASVGTALAGFPVWILAALLAVAGVLHILLLRDLLGPRAWIFALGVGLVGAGANLAWALGLGLVAWWLTRAVRRPPARPARVRTARR